MLKKCSYVSLIISARYINIWTAPPGFRSPCVGFGEGAELSGTLRSVPRGRRAVVSVSTTTTVGARYSLKYCITPLKMSLFLLPAVSVGLVVLVRYLISFAPLVGWLTLKKVKKVAYSVINHISNVTRIKLSDPAGGKKKSETTLA